MNSNQIQNEKADAILEQEIKDLNKLNNYNIPPQNETSNQKYNEEEIIINPEENDNNNIYNYDQVQDQGEYEEEENNEMNYEEELTYSKSTIISNEIFQTSDIVQQNELTILKSTIVIQFSICPGIKRYFIT